MSTISIRAFGLHDLPLFLKLQRHSMLFRLEQTLIRSRSPLWPALLSPFPWHGIGVATYILADKGRKQPVYGLAQMQKRPARPEADLLLLAPHLNAHIDADDIWGRLLSHCSIEAGKFGIQRLYATLPDDGEMLELFKQVGFSLYAKEDVFRLEQITRPEDATGASQIRPYREEDAWALQRLYAANTPRLVQQADGKTNGDAWAGREANADFAFVIEHKGDVTGAVQVETGEMGHWLRLQGNTQETEQMKSLLLRGLQVLAQHPALPVYCAVRDYQGGLCALLADLGFQPFATWNRLIRYTVARVKEAALKTVPALERGVEPTMSVGHNGNSGHADRPLPEPAHASAGKHI